MTGVQTCALPISGDLFTYGAATPQLIDYSSGGSAKAWTRTLDEIMQIGFETVVPGHGRPTTKEGMREFRDHAMTLRNRVQEMIRDGRSRDEVEAMLRADFGWADLHVNRGLDGLMGELR